MPHTRMWQIYAQSLQDRTQICESMHSVAQYCVIDAIRCQELLVKRNVIGNKREISALSYCSLYDAVYFADGLKVCNMLTAYAKDKNIVCSLSTGEKKTSQKYPGAWVFPPEKGLIPDPTVDSVVQLEDVRTRYIKGEATKEEVGKCLEHYQPGRPVTGLDFKSLYPSIIMTYNLSPEKFVATREEADNLISMGYRLHHVHFPYGDTMVEGWFVQHDNDPDKYGLYPSLLIDLLNKRTIMKKQLSFYARMKEHMEYIMGMVNDSDE